MNINLNQYVRVKLREDGLDILRRDWNELRLRAPKLGPWKSPKLDKDGYARFPLWELMQRFGPHIHLGFECPFELEIILETP